MAMIAALFVERGGCYFGLDDVDPWDVKRDARLYAGSHPVVAHPPCQLWVNFAALNFKRYGGEHIRPWRFGFDEQTEGDAVRRVFTMLKDVSPRKKQVYTMIGREPVDHCMDRIRKVIGWGGEPYAQPFLKLNALTKAPDVRHDWTAEKLSRVARWVNWRGWKGPNGTFRPFEDYDPSARSKRR